MKMLAVSRRRAKWCGAFLFAVLLFVLSRSAAFANSGPVNWYGVDANGLYVQGGDCPLQVERERLSFDLSQLPRVGETDDPSDYTGSVTADYFFHNPTDHTVSATLAFPIGPLPSYFDFGDGTGESIFPAASFSVTVDGSPVSCETRYTYLGYDETFDGQTQLNRISSEMESTTLLTPETTLTVFTYRVQALPENDGGRVFAKAEALPENVRAVCTDDGWLCLENGTVFLYNGDEMHVICFGDAPSAPTLAFFDWDSKTPLSSGEAVLQKKETLTLAAFFDQQAPGLSGSVRTDRYNAAVSSLDSWLRESEGREFDFSFSLRGELTPWCVYSITAAPGETLENTVTAPMYPEVDTNLVPASYSYTYYWSPAAMWAKFGDLDVQIRTPFSLRGCEPDAAVRTDDGYQLHFDSLPAGELRFTLGKTQYCFVNKGTVITGVFFFFVFGLPVFLVVLAVTRKIRKKK